MPLFSRINSKVPEWILKFKNVSFILMNYESRKLKMSTVFPERRMKTTVVFFKPMMKLKSNKL